MRLSALRSNVPDCELCAETNEDTERDDLERETGDGDIDCGFAASRRNGRQCATDGLED